jgi:hypothetical protein
MGGACLHRSESLEILAHGISISNRIKCNAIYGPAEAIFPKAVHAF